MEYLNFATRAADRHERSRQWQAITQARHAELDDDREASIRGCDLGDVRLCAVALGRHRVESDQPGSTGHDNGVIKFLFQDEGDCRVEQRGKVVTLAAGQWCAIDKTLPFSMTATRSGRQIALVLPRRRIVGWEQGGARRLVAPQGFLRGASQVLHSSIAAAVSAATVLGRRDRARLGDALVSLLNMSWHADPPIEGQRSQRGRRLAVIEFVERHLADPDLDISGIARALGHSKRTLHKLFDDDSMTVGRLIWDRRLEHCRQELLDPAQARCSITEVAHRWGFSDSQHFSRSFKARFGAAPREFRKAHLVH